MPVTLKYFIIKLQSCQWLLMVVSFLCIFLLPLKKVLMCNLTFADIYFFQPSWCVGYTFKQPQSSGKAEQSLYHCSNSYCRWNVFTLHSAPCLNEWIQSSWTQCSKRSVKVTLLLVRIYRRNGEGLHLCGNTITWRCFNG